MAVSFAFACEARNGAIAPMRARRHLRSGFAPTRERERRLKGRTVPYRSGLHSDPQSFAATSLEGSTALLLCGLCWCGWSGSRVEGWVFTPLQ